VILGNICHLPRQLIVLILKWGIKNNKEPDLFMMMNKESQKIPIDRLVPGEFQPRISFNKKSIEELSLSITKNGLIQPLIVKTIEKNKYEIVVGERRWRAASLAKISEVDCIIRDGLPPKDYFFISLSENIQRAELTPIEEARQFNKLIDDFNLSHKEIADNVGKSRVYITNKIRLLGLPIRIIDYIHEGGLSEGHGKALLAAEGWQQIPIAEQAIKYRWSVRKLESVINAPKIKKQKTDPDINLYEKEISEIIGATTKIKFDSQAGKGKLDISFYSLEELEGIIGHLKKRLD